MIGNELNSISLVFFIQFELYFREISYAKTLPALHLKAMESAKQHTTF